MTPNVQRASWDEAFSLLGMVCPCEAFRIVADGITRTPDDQPDVADAWIRLGERVTAVMSTVTVQ